MRTDGQSGVVWGHARARREGAQLLANGAIPFGQRKPACVVSKGQARRFDSALCPPSHILHSNAGLDDRRTKEDDNGK